MIKILLVIVIFISGIALFIALPKEESDKWCSDRGYNKAPDTETSYTLNITLTPIKPASDKKRGMLIYE